MQRFDASSQARDLWPVPVFRALSRDLGDYVVVGSIARDLWAQVAAGLPAGRLTEDLDVSVAVASITDLQERTRHLTGPNASGVRYRVEGVAVDVIPYGDIASDGWVEPSEGVVLDVTGMREAAATAVAVTLDDELVVKFASLPAMVALKVVAWGVRHPHTNKDAQDLALLLDASHSGVFEEDCWADEVSAPLWDYEPALVGPYRIGLAISQSFSAPSITRLSAVLTGVELDRLVAHLPSRAVPRAEQLEALRAGLGISTAG